MTAMPRCRGLRMPRARASGKVGATADPWAATPAG